MLLTEKREVLKHNKIRRMSGLSHSEKIVSESQSRMFQDQDVKLAMDGPEMVE